MKNTPHNRRKEALVYVHVLEARLTAEGDRDWSDWWTIASQAKALLAIANKAVKETK